MWPSTLLHPPLPLSFSLCPRQIPAEKHKAATVTAGIVLKTYRSDPVTEYLLSRKCGLAFGQRTVLLNKEGIKLLSGFKLYPTFQSFVSQHVSYQPFLCTNCQGREQEILETQ